MRNAGGTTIRKRGMHKKHHPFRTRPARRPGSFSTHPYFSPLPRRSGAQCRRRKWNSASVAGMPNGDHTDEGIESGILSEKPFAGYNKPNSSLRRISTASPQRIRSRLMLRVSSKLCRLCLVSETIVGAILPLNGLEEIIPTVRRHRLVCLLPLESGSGKIWYSPSMNQHQCKNRGQIKNRIAEEFLCGSVILS